MKVIRKKRHEKVDPHRILHFTITAVMASVSIIIFTHMGTITERRYWRQNYDVKPGIANFVPWPSPTSAPCAMRVSN